MHNDVNYAIARNRNPLMTHSIKLGIKWEKYLLNTGGWSKELRSGIACVAEPIGRILKVVK